MKKTIATLGIGAVAFAMGSIEASAMEKGTINTSALNIRTGPSTDYNRIDKAYKGNVVEILEKSNGWYRVKLSNGTIGWGSGQYITVSGQQNKPPTSTPSTNTRGKVTASPRLNIRSGPSTSYSILTTSNYGDVVELIEKSNGWYKVKLSNGTTGWGSGQYIVEITNSSGNTDNNNSNNGNNNTSNGNNNTNKPEDTKPPVSSNRDAIVNLAYDLIGTPYGWGGNGPDNFDCSGFTKYVYSKAEGKNIPRVSRDQAKYGVEVPRENYAPGDLVYFDTDYDGVVNHVGVYVGNNEFIHASGTPTNPDTVIKESLSTNYWTKVLVGARRF